VQKKKLHVLEEHVRIAACTHHQKRSRKEKWQILLAADHQYGHPNPD